MRLVRIVWSEPLRAWFVLEEDGTQVGLFETLLEAEASAIAESERREVEAS